MRLTTLDGGINWNWYLQADYDDEAKTAHIYFYQRWHKYEDRGSAHPQVNSKDRPEILEGPDRAVYGIRKNKIEYLVTNPANIFSYRDMTHYQPEKLADIAANPDPRD